MYFVDEEFVDNKIETGDLVKHVDDKLFLAIHDIAEGVWLLIGMDGTIGEHVKSYSELATYYRLAAKSKDLKLSIKKQVE